MRIPWIRLLGGALLAAAALPSRGALPPPPDKIPLPNPIPLIADVSVDPPALTPTPVVPGSTGYAAAATVHATGNTPSINVRVRVELRAGGNPLESSELLLGTMAAGTAKTVILPALFDTPLAASFDLVAIVSSDNDSDSSNDSATAHPAVLPLPFALHWAGFTVQVSGYDPTTTGTDLKGSGALILGGTPAASVPVSFDHVAVDAAANVTAGDTLALAPTPRADVHGPNGADLLVSQITLPALGPMTVNGDLFLPASAGVELVNGATSLPMAGKTFQPDLTIQDTGINDLVLRDLPLELHPTGTIDASLSADAMLPLQGTAVGRPSWNAAAPGATLAVNSSNDGLFLGPGGATAPPNFVLIGLLKASTGIEGSLTLPAASTVAYSSLFPRAIVGFNKLKIDLAGGAVSGVTGHAGVGYRSATSLPLNPDRTPTSLQPVIGEMDVAATDAAGGFGGHPAMAQPADGRYAWVAPESDPSRKVFFAKDAKPILFMLGGRTPTLPHSYFVSRLKLDSGGVLMTTPRSAGSTAAPLDPGLNLVTGVTSPQADEEIAMNLVGSSGSITLPGPKLNIYLRAGGVSGVWGAAGVDATTPVGSEFYGANGPGAWGVNRGFPVQFTNVSLGFLDSDVRASNLAGKIDLRAPIGAGVAGGNAFDFAGMTVKRDGQLGQSNVPPSGAATQELAFWKTLIQPKGVYFQQFNDYLATTKTFLGLNAAVGFTGGKYVQNPFAVDDLLFGGPGYPHPTRYGHPHMAMENAWMAFGFHPEGIRLSDPDPTDPSTLTPVPWSDDTTTASKATVQDRPGASAAAPASAGLPGWVEIKGAIKLPFYGDKDITTFVDSRDDYVTLDAPLSLHRELFAGMDVGGDQFVFEPSSPDKNGHPRPNCFLASFNWALPANLLSADGGIQLFDQGLGNNNSRFFLGAEANLALLDTVGNVVDKVADISDPGQQTAYLDKIYGKLGIVGKDYDPAKANALAQKITGAGSPVPTGWASGISGGIDTAHGVMQTLYQDAKDGSGALSPISDAVNSTAKDAINFSKSFSGDIPVKLRYLRGFVELHDDVWDTIDAEAGGRIDRLVQDANLKFMMNRHGEYRLDLDAAKITVPFTDLASGATNGSEDRKSGLEIDNPYLHLLLDLPPDPKAPRLDGAMGLGKFNLLDAITIDGVGIPPPTDQGLVVDNIDASFGIGAHIAYLGAALGIEGTLIDSMTEGIANKVSAGFLAGVGIDDQAIDITGVIKPDIKAALKEGLAASGGGATLNGLLIEAGFGNSLIDAGCLLKAGYSVDAALWTFLVTGASTNAILGGRLYGEIDGEAVCVVSIKGELTLLAQYLTMTNDLKVQGTGHVGGSIDLLFTSIDFGAGVMVTAETNPTKFDVGVSVD